LQQSQLPLLMPKRLVALGHQCFGGEYAIPTYHVKLERWDENQIENVDQQTCLSCFEQRDSRCSIF
jgi:hypothetical protein